MFWYKVIGNYNFDVLKRTDFNKEEVINSSATFFVHVHRLFEDASIRISDNSFFFLFVLFARVCLTGGPMVTRSRSDDGIPGKPRESL